MDITATLQQALAHHRQGELLQAEMLYREILAQMPTHFDALHLLGVAQHQQGRSEPAIDLIRRAIAINPIDAAAHSNLGLALRRLSRPIDAIASFDAALALKPDHLPSLNNRGNALRDLGRNEEALATYDRALAINPKYVEALKNRGAVLIDLKRQEEALQSYEQALARNGDDAEAIFGRGNALMMLARPEEALACYERVLSREPDRIDALKHRGSALLDLERYDAAIASIDRALAVKPDDAEALNNRGNALVEQNRHREALASFDRATSVLPDHADAEYNASLCRLALGDFEAGWKGYESRWRTGAFRESLRDFNAPPWLGESSIEGKTVLLHCEQGFGDTLQFCRYAPLVAAMGATVVIEARAPVAPLLATLEGVACVVSDGESLPHFDYHCPLLSLPRVFNTTLETIPAKVPYLHADPRRVSSWQVRLGVNTQPRIGLAWAGSTAHRTDHKRSIPLLKMAPLVAQHARFVSLQKDLRPSDAAVLRDRFGMADSSGDLCDFADTAALIATLDVVISADTAVAHLAGALGKEVWILVPFHPDWRWLLDREDSPWYPTARLFRQSRAGDWDGVIGRVTHELAKRPGR